MTKESMAKLHKLQKRADAIRRLAKEDPSIRLLAQDILDGLEEIEGDEEERTMEAAFDARRAAGVHQ